MLWRKGQTEDADLFKMARVNDRVQLEIRGRAYLSRVEDVIGDEMHVAAPFEHGNIVSATPGQEIIVNVFAGAGLRRFKSKASRMVIERVSLIALKDFADMGDVQRRDFVRVPDRLPVRFRLEDGQESLKPWWSAITRDISGGGAKIISPISRELRSGDFVQLEIPIPSDKTVQAIARVARVSTVPTSGGNSTGYGVQFVEIDPADRRRIVQHVLKRQAALIDSGRPRNA